MTASARAVRRHFPLHPEGRRLPHQPLLLPRSRRNELVEAARRFRASPRRTTPSSRELPYLLPSPPKRSRVPPRLLSRSFVTRRRRRPTQRAEVSSSVRRHRVPAGQRPDLLPPPPKRRCRPTVASRSPPPPRTVSNALPSPTSTATEATDSVGSRPSSRHHPKVTALRQDFDRLLDRSRTRGRRFNQTDVCNPSTWFSRASTTDRRACEPLGPKSSRPVESVLLHSRRSFVSPARADRAPRGFPFTVSPRGSGSGSR